MRPISNVVDVTNYVMLALGNPLARVRLLEARRVGRIVVRRAKPGEKLRTLDGVDRELEPYDLMIADAERAVALAGIMGGEETEIGEGTTEILLEAANFEPYTIFRTSERLRLRTEGSNRWEKGVDPYLARAGSDAGDAAASSSWRVRAGSVTTDVHAHAARAAGGPLPARAGRRRDRDRDSTGRAACASCDARLRRGG